MSDFCSRFEVPCILSKSSVCLPRTFLDVATDGALLLVFWLQACLSFCNELVVASGCSVLSLLPLSEMLSVTTDNVDLDKAEFTFTLFLVGRSSVLSLPTDRFSVSKFSLFEQKKILTLNCFKMQTLTIFSDM